MFKVGIALFGAAWCVAVYFIVNILSRRDERGRALWRKLITPTPVDAFPVHDKGENTLRISKTP